MSINRTATGGMAAPSGAIMQFTATTIPTGWLLCYGQAVSRSTYSALFAVISTTYGTGDGSTTFNLPDLRGRVPVGLDNMGGSDAGLLDVANTMGGSGGEQYHLLTGAQTGTTAHTHTQNPHSHALSQSLWWSTGATAVDWTPYWYIDGTPYTDYATATNIATTAADASSAYNVMQPYMLLNFIIKT